MYTDLNTEKLKETKKKKPILTSWHLEFSRGTQIIKTTDEYSIQYIRIKERRGIEAPGWEIRGCN